MKFKTEIIDFLLIKTENWGNRKMTILEIENRNLLKFRLLKPTLETLAKWSE